MIYKDFDKELETLEEMFNEHTSDKKINGYHRAVLHGFAHLRRKLSFLIKGQELETKTGKEYFLAKDGVTPETPIINDKKRKK